MIRRAGQGHDGRLVVWVPTTIVEAYIHIASNRIDGQRGEEMIGAVVQRIVVYAYRGYPVIPAVDGARKKDIHFTVPVIGPDHVQPSVWRTGSRTGIDCKLWKAVGARKPFEVVHDGSRGDDIPRPGESATAVARAGESDVARIGPNRVQRAIRAHCAPESLVCT